MWVYRGRAEVGDAYIPFGQLLFQSRAYIPFPPTWQPSSSLFQSLILASFEPPFLEWEGVRTRDVDGEEYQDLYHSEKGLGTIVHIVA